MGWPQCHRRPTTALLGPSSRADCPSPNQDNAALGRNSGRDWGRMPDPGETPEKRRNQLLVVWASRGARWLSRHKKEVDSTLNHIKRLLPSLYRSMALTWSIPRADLGPRISVFRATQSGFLVPCPEPPFGVLVKEKEQHPPHSDGAFSAALKAHRRARTHPFVVLFGASKAVLEFTSTLSKEHCI